ncbi:trithorax group protein osa-like [Uloborus diversus]|uniref:trithorax group protein osa-like n=1 Tax=Uloborus diversus TaxID=327109 RepID=UPI002409A0CE|nr:trithorax group protein osa-like [Uloborus diversus]
MATPAHARMACPEQKTPESGDQEGSESLKNGTTLEDSDDSTGNVLVKNRVRSPAAGTPQHRDMTMDSFQDGGTTPQPNSRPASANIEGNFPASMDRTRLDYQAFNQSTNRENSEDFRNSSSQENFNHGGGCDMNYSRGSYSNNADQHGGQGNTSDMSTNSQSNKMYPQYNQPQMRPGYPQGPRNVGMGPQQRPPGPAMSGGYPGGNNSQQQRFLSGPSLSQQTGPTPTLNQLLQAPNSLQRYHNNYDYSASQGLHKNLGDPNASQYQGPNSSWGNMRGSSGYPQQMSPSMYRNQGGPVPDPSMKRPYMSPSQVSGGANAPSQGQYPQQYHPYSQSQPQGAPVRPVNQSYTQQGVQQYPGMQQQQHGPGIPPPQPSQMSGAYEPHPRQPQMSPYGGGGGGPPQPGAPPTQQQPAPSPQQQPPPPNQQSAQQQQQTPPSQQQPPPHGSAPPSQQAPQPQQQPSPQQQPPSHQQQQQQQQHPQPAQQTTQQPPTQQQQQQQSQQSSQDASGSEDIPSERSGSTTPGLRNPTTPPHPVVSPHRPAPSPSGSSAGSPSMSPALGQQPNIPMPPRPSSNQSDSSGQVQMSQPALSSQGYNQQMAPPSAMYGNKMHQNMMGSSSSHMAPYSPQPASHYPQSGYHRPPGTMSMHNYGNQAQNNYPGPYPAQSPMGPHRMPSHPNPAPSNYGNQSGTTPGYNSSQYPNSAPPSASYNMNNMMPPPNQYPKSSSMPPPTGGAQAAAQAAVIAAAASSTTIRQSPMYLRQHLQQKMYANNYNSAISPVPPGAPGNGGQDSPMPPPASTPSSQPMSMSQVSMPPSTSLGNASSCDGPMPASMVPAGFTQTSAPTIGMPPTTVTQSISSPVPSAVTVSSPSVPDMMQSQQMRTSTLGGPQGPPPPPVMDEGSQASNASASSSLPEERVETPKPNNKPTMSHPPTPNTLPSPGAASMSSFHDEFESVSSPSWPRTPASPVINNQPYDHHPIKRPDGMLKLYDLSDDPDRRLFLDKLIMYQEERGTPLSQCPTISKQPLDLYRLYLATKERGGFVEVMKGKQWKEIAGLIGIGASSSAAYTLRKQYIKHLLPFECKYDRGGIDPGPIISSLESNSRKKNAKNAGGGPMMDGYPSPYPAGYPPNTGPHPGMMSGSDYPGPGHHPPYQDSMHHPGAMVNHSGSEGAMDPFSDEMQGSQYQQRHSTNDSYGYSQSNANSNMPPYSGNPPSVPSTSYGYSNTSGQQEQYGDQYSNTMVPPSSEPSYNSRNMVPADPYAPPPGGYPPNRTVGPSNSSQYPPYQNPCEQDRYEQATPQSPMIRPPAPSSSVIGPSPQQDSSYPPHRYPNQPMSSREGMPPQQMGSYQGRPAMGPSQYPGPNSQASGQSPYPPSQPESYRSSEFQPQMSRLQSTLIQRLLPKNQTAQNYPASQQGMYGQSMPPPNKVAPPSNIPGNMYQRDMYGMGSKRHNDYPKPHGPVQDQYHMGNYPQQPTQGPYSDRSQYPYRPAHGVPPPPTPGPPQQGWPRDNRQYPSGQSQYPPGQRDSWDITRHGDGPPQPGAPNWMRYGGPQSEPYPHHMSPSMGPKMMSRGYGSPNKMAPHGGVGPPPQYASQNQRKEVLFPPDSVEAVQPLITKRRRLLSKDITPIEAWRIMMALKSGLLGESTWALDVLGILVNDDATVLYFGLNHLPGLLEVLMDHYRRCLNIIFDLVGDLEIGFMLNPGDKTVEHNKKWFELECDMPNSISTEVSVPEFLRSDKTAVLDSVNYTYKTRCKKVVKIQQQEALFLLDPDKKWDVHEGFIGGSSHWQHGGGEYTGYIQTQFETTRKNIKFVRLLQKSTKNKKYSKSLNTQNKPVKLKNSSDSCSIKKECGSDTEEDESLNSPEPSVLDEANSDAIQETSRTEEDETGKNSNSLDSNPQVKPEKSSENTETSEKDELKSGNSVESEKDNPEVMESNFPKMRPISPTRKRRAVEDLEDESYNRDEPSLCTTYDDQDSLARRCIALSTILRNLSFVPGNDTEMSKHPGFLLVMGRLLLLHHVHSPRKPPQRHYDREEEGESSSIADSCSSLNSEHEWWWDMLHSIRENTLVTLANIAGQLDLAPFPEEISFPMLDGLMHWVTCPSSYAQDPLPTQPSHSVLSPQRLSLEALSKLSVLESNVDLMMATPPWERIDRFFSLLSKWLSRNEDQVLREFSVVLLSNLSQADSSMARAIALQGTCIPLLITFVEQAEQSALQVANSQGINALRENPELMGTTLDMVRRAAGTLRCLARVPSNRTLFLQHQQRLLALVMSQILDQGVASIIADVLFECSQEDAEDLPSITNGEKESSPLPVEAAT